MVSKIFEKIVNIGQVDHFKTCGVFFEFQYGLRSSQSTEDLLAVVSNKITRAFYISGTTCTVALDIF